MLWAALGVAWLGRGRGLPMMEIPPPTNAKIPIRCIKTDRSPTPRRRGTRRVREHRAPYGAPRRGAPQAFDKTSRVPRLRPHNEASPANPGRPRQYWVEEHLRPQTRAPLRRMPSILSLPPRHPGSIPIGRRGG